MKPQEFIATSDYATLKNDSEGVISLTLPNSLNVAAGSTASLTSSLTIGTPGSSFRSRIVGSVNNVSYVATNVGYGRTSGATVSGFSVGYEVFVSVHRTSPTQLSLIAFIPNPYGATLAITSGLAGTVTAYVATFLPPYP